MKRFVAFFISLDRWLLAKRLRWRTAFFLFALMAVAVFASILIEGGHVALVLMMLFLLFVLRYIRPNV